MDSVCSCVLVLSLLFECGHSDYLSRFDSPDDLLQKNNQGETASYRVNLPVTSPQPKVNAIASPGVKLVPNQVTSHKSLQLTNSYGVGGGLPANKRFRRQPQTNLHLTPEIEKILQRFGASDKIGDVDDGFKSFPSFQEESKKFDNYFEQLYVSKFKDVTFPSIHSRTTAVTEALTQATEESTQATEEPTQATLETSSPSPEAARYSDITVTTDECGGVAGGNERPVPLIHNGRFYDRGELPWLVAIYRTVQTNLLFICGGTLLTDRHVISAAHCMSRGRVLTPFEEIVIKIGVHRLNDWSDDLTVRSKLIAMNIYEDYDPVTFKNDILIFTLYKRVQFTQYIRPICLWSGDTELSRVVGATGVVAGWGSRSSGDTEKQDEPEMVRVPIVSTKECRASNSVFHKLTYDNTLCAGDRNGAGPCNGDSGGGLYLLEGGKWRLRGIVSVSPQPESGGRVCNLNEYIVYTDTAQFLPWIREILSQKYYD